MVSVNSTKTFGYETDNGDLPPTFNKKYSGDNIDINDNDANDEKDPIYRSNDHSLPTLEQVRTEAVNVLARQQYSSSSSTSNASRFHDDIQMSSSYDDYKYTDNTKSGVTNNRRRFKLLLVTITCIVAAIVTVSVIVSTSRNSNNSKSMEQQNKQQNNNDIDFTTDDADTDGDGDADVDTNGDGDVDANDLDNNNNNNNDDADTDGDGDADVDTDGDGDVDANDLDNNDDNNDNTKIIGTDDEKRIAIKNLLQIKISLLEDMETINTPQYNAVEWLVQATNNINTIPVPDDNNYIDYNNSYEFIQKYIAAVLYYSFDGPNWYNDCNFLSNELNVCNWNTRINRNNTDTDTDDYIFGIRCDTSYNDGSVGDDEITHIYLPGNNMVGTLPVEIGDFLELEQLSLYDNQISGSIPERMSYLSHLWFIQLQSNQITGSIPDWIGTSLPFLEYLGLSDNQLVGSIPTNLFTNTTDLREIDLSYNSLTGSISLFDIDDCPPDLKLVYLNNNQLSGRVHDLSFINCQSLDEIDLSHNTLTGYVPQHFYNFTVVSLDHNALAGDLIYGAENFNNDTFYPIEYLSLGHNQITGTLPDSLSLLYSLKHLDLCNNSLTGFMDNIEYDTMEQLEYLYLSYNNFTEGPIPQLSDISTLKELSLSNTNRIGTIPISLKSLSNIELIDLQSNELTGPIPFYFGEFTELAFVFLNRNQLNGTVPESFASLGSTAYSILLDHNDLIQDQSLDFICDTKTDTSLQLFINDCTSTCTCCTSCCQPDDDECNHPDRIEDIQHVYSKDHFLYVENIIMRDVL